MGDLIVRALIAQMVLAVIVIVAASIGAWELFWYLWRHLHVTLQ